MESKWKTLTRLGAALFAVACWTVAPLAADETPKTDTPAAQDAAKAGEGKGHSCCCCCGGGDAKACAHQKAEGAEHHDGHAHHGAAGEAKAAPGAASAGADKPAHEGGCCHRAAASAEGKSGCC